MIKFCPLVSGSSGNATFISYKNTKILVDCGVSARQIKYLLGQIGESLQDISAILITHEHSDHVKGAGVLFKTVPVYATEKTWQAMTRRQENAMPALARVIAADETIELNDLTVQPFSIPHDAADPVGYNLMGSNKKVTVATDMGKISESVATAIRGSDTILLESNYDPGMLQNGRYPWFLKNRITSNLGHLSNEQAATLCCAFVRSGTRRIILGHLSENNNLPDMAFGAVKDALCQIGADQDIFLEVAQRYAPSTMHAV